MPTDVSIFENSFDCEMYMLACCLVCLLPTVHKWHVMLQAEGQAAHVACSRNQGKALLPGNILAML